MKPTILLFYIVSFISCDRPECRNTNPIFEQHQPAAEEYKSELVKQIKSIDEKQLDYWIESYIERNKEAFMNVHVQGGELCALMQINITQSEKLEHYKNVKGVSYRGAKFSGLKYEIMQSYNGTAFIYKDHKRIID